MLQRTETYGYDAQLDYLTSVNYGDGSPVQTWQYDAAGNRSAASATPGAWVYDNLNRMTASPWASYVNSSLGSRLSETSGEQTTAYRWDAVQRMAYRGPAPGGALTGHAYTYRADGMRVRKQNQAGLAANGALVFHTAGNKVTRTYHEGQMAAEEEVLQGGALQTLTRSFLGGRGLEAMTTTESGNTTTAYPLYDTHGNMVATLTKNAAGTSWNVGNLRSYDVWGAVRSGAATGGPSGRYVANLGHVQDDESGLIYMRARYYEPGTGRFISEDPAMDGGNWFVYCASNPLGRVDFTGRDWTSTSAFVLGYGLVAIAYCSFSAGNRDTITEISLWGPATKLSADSKIKFSYGYAACLAAVSLFAYGFARAGGSGILASEVPLALVLLDFAKITYTVATGMEMGAQAARGLAQAAILGTSAYSLACIGVLVSMQLD